MPKCTNCACNCTTKHGHESGLFELVAVLRKRITSRSWLQLCPTNPATCATLACRLLRSEARATMLQLRPPLPVLYAHSSLM